MTSTTSHTHVRLNRTPTVHVAAMLDGRVIGRACNQWPGGGHTKLRVEITQEAVTCKACLRIVPDANTTTTSTTTTTHQGDTMTTDHDDTHTVKACPECRGPLTEQPQRYGQGWHDCPACGWRETSPTDLQDYVEDEDQDDDEPCACGCGEEQGTTTRPQPACGHTICVDRPLCAYTGHLTGVTLVGLEGGPNSFLVLVLQDAKTALDKLRITRDVVDTIQASTITLALEGKRFDVVHELSKPFRSSFYANQAAELKARCQQQADKLWSEDNPGLPSI